MYHKFKKNILQICHRENTAMDVNPSTMHVNTFAPTPFSPNYK